MYNNSLKDFSSLAFCLKPCSGTGFNGRSIYLRDIWPTRKELHTVEEECVISSMFKELKEKMEVRNGLLF